jgi:antitoxin VapB
MNEIKTSRVWPAHLVQQDGRKLVEIPEDFEMAAQEYTIKQEGAALLVEPKPLSLREFLDTVEPVDVDWPDVDEGLLPLEDVKL